MGFGKRINHFNDQRYPKLTITKAFEALSHYDGFLRRSPTVLKRYGRTYLGMYSDRYRYISSGARTTGSASRQPPDPSSRQQQLA